MKRNITYNWGDRNLLITLGNRVDGRIRALYVAEFVFTLSMATIFMLQSVPLRHSLMNWVAVAGASLLYMLAAYRFLARMLFKEELMVDGRNFTIVRKTVFSRRVDRYKWNEMGPLHYQGKTTKTDHPLKGKSFDYFGFETQEHLIQSLHDEGNLFFEYFGRRIYFAPGVYSWDAEKLVQMINLYNGSKLKLGPEWDDMLPEQEIDDTHREN